MLYTHTNSAHPASRPSGFIHLLGVSRTLQAHVLEGQECVCCLYLARLTDNIVNVTVEWQSHGISGFVP